MNLSTADENERREVDAVVNFVNHPWSFEIEFTPLKQDEQTAK